VTASNSYDLFTNQILGYDYSDSIILGHYQVQCKNHDNQVIIICGLSNNGFCAFRLQPDQPAVEGLDRSESQTLLVTL